MSDLVYIGDNPKKDFIIKKNGIITIRLLRGIYKNLKLEKNKEANYNVKNMKMILKYL